MSSDKGFKKTVHNFYERQKYRVWIWYFITLSLVLGLATHIFIKFLSMPAFSWSLVAFLPELILLSLFLVLFVFFFHIRNLVTAINEQGIFVRWAPFSKNYFMLLWDDIREVSLVKTGGTRVSSGYSQVWFTGSSTAIEIVSKSRRKKIISTRKAESLARILQRTAPSKFKVTGVGEQTDFRD
jgi:hypothetical protein